MERFFPIVLSYFMCRCGVLSLLSKIIGIDILAGASSQKGTASANRFAAVVLEKGETIESYNSLFA